MLTVPPKRTVRDVESQSSVTLREFLSAEKPRERLRDHGAAALSNAELLAILLRVGNSSENVIEQAARLLRTFGGLEGLARASFPELCAQYGFGTAKASQLHAAMELGKRMAVTRGATRMALKTPEDVFHLLRPEMALLGKEQFRVIVLNTKKEIVANQVVFVESVNSTTIRVAEVFREAVRLNGPYLVVAHNHPSGDPTPSAEDLLVTRELTLAGRQLDIELLDHIVIAQGGYVSLQALGVGFPRAAKSPRTRHAE
ncbi:MAG: JAB domain-containing protein [SAR202 cluster bacterium]|nr:JAB domain-containing protein [SAR202 cluster bacterium]